MHKGPGLRAEDLMPVAPVQVIAWFRRSFNHGHLRGSTAGDWPLQVTSTDDAARQIPIARHRRSGGAPVDL